MQKSARTERQAAIFLFFHVIHPGVDSLFYVRLSAVMTYSLLVRFKASDSLKRISPPCSGDQERNDDE